MVDVSLERFEELVADALDEIPDDLWRLMDNVAVVVREGSDGLGAARALRRRPAHRARPRLRRVMVMPDRITIFRLPILAMCADEAEVVRAGADHGHPRGGPPLRHRRRAAPRARLGLSDYASPVPFSRKLLNEDEDVVLDLHPHWVYFLKSGLLFLARGGRRASCSLDAGTTRPTALGIPSGVLILLALVWFGWTYLKWVTTNFVITTDRLIYRHGVLSKHGIEIPLERVNTVFFSQSILERMVGSGDLVIESAGELGRQDFSNVRKPSAVQNEIHKQMEANENRKFDRVNAPRPRRLHPRRRSPSSTTSASGASSPRPSSTRRSRSSSTGCEAQRSAASVRPTCRAARSSAGPDGDEASRPAQAGRPVRHLGAAGHSTPCDPRRGREDRRSGVGRRPLAWRRRTGVRGQHPLDVVGPRRRLHRRRYDGARR